MKDGYNTLNLTLPIFILAGFISICAVAAFAAMVQGIFLGGI